ncbi:ACP S-malonyltransferase [Micromonospora sp. CA-248089]|uniref:ACP S-malonyltransferase n=1 Tax=Micromonospora sp. CA-248089 TaxID=3239960 RepID=UPI003D8F5991
MLAIVAPGQGSQTPGFLATWTADAAFADRLRWYSAVCGLDLPHYGTRADAEAIRDTAIAQPLLVAAGLAVIQALREAAPAGWTGPEVIAGHSAGELTAAAAAGVITAEQAIVLSRERGRGMAETAARIESGMAAVVGGDATEVLAVIERCGLEAVTYNGPGQVVASGSRRGIAELVTEPPARARVVPLEISGGFHSRHVAHVGELLRDHARAMDPADPLVILLSNSDGRVVRTGREALDLIANQVSAPVRWDLCMRRMIDLGVTGMLELAPAGTLTKIARRALPGVQTFALHTADQLSDACDFALQHHRSPASLAS